MVVLLMASAIAYFLLPPSTPPPPPPPPPNIFEEVLLEDARARGYDLDTSTVRTVGTCDSVCRYEGEVIVDGRGLQVPTQPYEPPADWDTEARDMAADLLVVAEGLPPGTAYDFEAASPTEPQRVSATWTVAWAPGADALGETERVEFQLRPAQPGAFVQGGTSSLMTAEGVAEAEAFQREAERVFEEAWETMLMQVERRTQDLRANAPAGCAKNTGALINEITRLTTNVCPSLSGREYDDCRVDIQRLNSELGDCQTRNQAREEALSNVRQSTAVYRQEQMDALRTEFSAGTDRPQ
ncbi:MAG: hypothetical protein AAGG50_06230 [Bacteroidota bacterium]